MYSSLFAVIGFGVTLSITNANMNTYGDIMTYLLRIEQRGNLAQSARDALVYNYMVQRYKHLKVLRKLLVVCQEELTGVITAEEAKQKGYDIKHPSEEAALPPAF